MSLEMIWELKMNNFKEIKEAWDSKWPEFLKTYQETGNMSNDPYFFIVEFTPIEEAMWQDLRGSGMPFYPQFPVLKYFIDFACPFLKIAVECDGKQWHSREKDEKRELELAWEGWTIFRVTGAECNKIMDCPWELEEDDDPYKIWDWFMHTSTGVAYAINQVYFVKNHSQFARDHIDLCYQTLDMHQPKNAAYREMPIVEFMG
jgi:very-short-patch-repair endonuclease